jgi:hypothetical protein
MPDWHPKATALWAAFEELVHGTPDQAAIVGLQLSVVLASLGRIREMHVASSRVCQLSLSNETLRFAAQCVHAGASLMLGDRHPFDVLERQVSPSALLEFVADPDTQML